jgi:glycosyltransferase involved in cell wall biosynthesis
MRWLFVTSRFPWPIVDGHWLRVYHLARTLVAQGDSVAILSFPGNEEGLAAYAEAGVDVLPGPVGEYVAWGPGRVAFSPYAFDARLAEAVAAHAGRADAVVLSGAKMLQFAPEAVRARTVMADLIDDPVLEYGRRGGRSGGLRERARRVKKRVGRLRYERRYLKFVKSVTFVSQADCESFRRRHPAAPIACIANGVSLEYFERPADWPQNGKSRRTIVFTGHMSNPNNERAAQFLVGEVAPILWRRCPEAVIQIVGAEPTDAVRALAAERVEVTGRVDDMRPYLWNAAVVAIPMQSGTGIKNKLLEAWAAGAPVVATTLACQGVTARNGENLLVADRAEEFAHRLAALLDDSDLRTRIGEMGRETTVRESTWTGAATALRSLARRAAECTATAEPAPRGVT